MLWATNLSEPSPNAQPNLAITSAVACSSKVKTIGQLTILCNGFALFGILMFDYQSGGHGEMGSFYRGILPETLLFAGWGLATGIGLRRGWSWARISTLIFSGLLAACGILAILAYLGMPAGDVSARELIVLRIVSTLQFLIPVGVGAKWLIFFNRKEVKAYFHASR